MITNSRQSRVPKWYESTLSASLASGAIIGCGVMGCGASGGPGGAAAPAAAGNGFQSGAVSDIRDVSGGSLSVGGSKTEADRSQASGDRSAMGGASAAGGAAGSMGVAGPGGGGVGTGAWRPFSNDSPWNVKIASNPELDPNSDALITDFKTSSQYGGHLDINIADYSIPLYWADSSTPKVSVLADIGGEGWTSSDGYNATALMPIPSGATPDPESDHHLLVIDRQLMREWGCWNLVLKGGSWHAGLCATSDLTGTGVRAPTNGNPTWYTSHGARACGFPLVAGLIRMDEIQAGRIDHALVIAYPHIRAGWYTPPASTAQAANGSGAQADRGIPCGGRIQFDPSVNLDKLGVSRSGRIVLLALQEYGAYVGDYSGAIDLYAENGAEAKSYWDGGVLDSYELNGQIDLASFRVLKLGRLYDNGNG